MSYVGAFPAQPVAESESSLLVDAALARVRKDAGLDDDPVFPPIEVLLGQSRLSTPSVRRVPTAEAIVKAAANAAAPSAVQLPRQAVTIPSRTKQTQAKSFAQRMSWPVFLCGFVGGIFGGVAVMKSPVGAHPAVQHVVKKVQSQGAHVYSGIASSRFGRH